MMLVATNNKRIWEKLVVILYIRLLCIGQRKGLPAGTFVCKVVEIESEAVMLE